MDGPVPGFLDQGVHSIMGHLQITESYPMCRYSPIPPSPTLSLTTLPQCPVCPHLSRCPSIHPPTVYALCICIHMNVQCVTWYSQSTYKVLSPFSASSKETVSLV